MKKYNVAILGGTGFVGAELYRILSLHPSFDVRLVSSEKFAGQFVEKTYKHFRYGNIKPNLKFSSINSLETGYDIIFSALPTGVLPLFLDKILGKTNLLINVSGDFRFSDESILKEYYPDSIGVIKDSSLVNYFIPELSPINKKAKIINLPGCMALAAIYSIYPLIKNNLINENIVIEAKTGSSGAGKSTTETHAERSNNFRLYKAFNHRHLPEIQKLGANFCIQFSAFSLDISRGIYVSAYSSLKENTSKEDVRIAFHQTYKDSYFVHVLKTGTPMLKTVMGTNHVEISHIINGKFCLSMVTLDNLIKGAAGQAIQAANMHCNLPEELGLSTANRGIWP